jgi:hypothetical protein
MIVRIYRLRWSIDRENSHPKSRVGCRFDLRFYDLQPFASVSNDRSERCAIRHVVQ